MNMDKEVITENILIEEFEDKVAKNSKPFSRFKSPIGWFSCFDPEICRVIKQNLGKSCKISYENNDNYRNIKVFHSSEEIKSKPLTKANGNASMYISYVKDLVISGMEINKAIETINLARKAFE